VVEDKEGNVHVVCQIPCSLTAPPVQAVSLKETRERWAYLVSNVVTDDAKWRLQRVLASMIPNRPELLLSGVMK